MAGRDGGGGEREGGQRERGGWREGGREREREGGGDALTVLLSSAYKQTRQGSRKHDHLSIMHNDMYKPLVPSKKDK